MEPNTMERTPVILSVRKMPHHDTQHRASWKRYAPGMLSIVLVLLLGLFGYMAPALMVSAATAPTLGTAQSFAVLGGSTVTNTGPTTISGGHMGVNPGLAMTGFPPGLVNPPGVIHAGDAVAGQAQSDTTTAYNNLAGQPCSSDLTGQDLGGKTLTPGVYCFSSSAQLTGTLTLNAQGNAGAVFIFKTGTTLTTASNSSVQVINGGSVCNAYWKIGSSATLGTNTAFAGNLLALASIAMNTNATISGRVLARTGAVTMDSNSVSMAGCGIVVPAPTPTTAPTATVAVPTATVAVPTSTVAVPTATRIAPTVIQPVIAATQPIPAATQTAIAAQPTVPGATPPALAATQIVTPATQAAIPATQIAPTSGDIAIKSAPANGAPANAVPANGASANSANVNNAPANRAPVNAGGPYRIPPNGAPSNGIPQNGSPYYGAAPYNGQAPNAPVAQVNTALSTPVIASSTSVPTTTVTVAATPTSASATDVATVAATRAATATVMIPARLPSTGGGGMAKTFTETTDTHHGADVALWIALVALLTLTSAGLLHVRRARQ